MHKTKSFFLIPVLTAAVWLTSCQTTETKRVAVKPPVQASAPSTQANSADRSAAPAETVGAQESPAENTGAKIDAAAELIKKVEREYQQGQANYNAGHLEAAKDNFDRAFNMLLEGPPPVKSDPRLEREFDKIVEGTHNLELLALQQGDGFSEQPAEPAPIDEANEVTFPIDPNIRAKAEQELKTTRSDLPLTLNDAVASYISYFSNRGRSSLEHGYVRAGRYHEMVSRIFRQQGIPQDLIYLAQAESGFHPLALSRAGARGMWQFMSSRAAQYGLDRNWWVDDRQDPEKATVAAAKHLKDLYNEFGDWYLAMAAYNSGPGTVQHAVERTGYADFWELYKRGVLPAETRNYVPIILAITIMSKNPSQYGLDGIQPDEPIQYDNLTINYPVDLRLVAECVDAPLSTLQELNPSLIRMTTPKNEKFDLHIPVGTAERYQQAIAAIPVDKRVLWHYHKVVPGETLSEIAHKYHTTVEAISEANNLEGDVLSDRASLIIPVKPGQGDSRVIYSKTGVRYKVRRGDNLGSLATDFGTTVEMLRKWNHLKSNNIRAGSLLIIHRQVGREEEPRSSSKAVEETESDGTPRPCTKWERRHGKRVCVARAAVEPSKRRKESSPETARKDERDRAGKGSHKQAARVLHHKVKKGETLTSIANQYNTTVSALMKANGKNSTHIKAGSVLVITQDTSD